MKKNDVIFAIRFFGAFILEKCGQIVRIPGSKPRELLAYLAFAKGRPHRKQTVASALWPEKPDDLAIDSLYKAYGRLRVLSEQGIIPALHIERNMLWMDMENVTLDITEFETLLSGECSLLNLEKAVDCYQGPFLGEETYEWTDLMQSHYDILYMEALEKLSEIYKSMGRTEHAYYFKKLME